MTMSTKSIPAQAIPEHGYPGPSTHSFLPLIQLPSSQCPRNPMRRTAMFLRFTVKMTPIPSFLSKSNSDSFPKAPARSAVQWEKVASSNDLGQENPYQGPPSPEVDAAWRDLLKNSNICISGETLRKLNRESVQLSDGSGEYFGGLNVHHHLHCIVCIPANSLSDRLLTTSWDYARKTFGVSSTATTTTSPKTTCTGRTWVSFDLQSHVRGLLSSKLSCRSLPRRPPPGNHV